MTEAQQLVDKAVGQRRQGVVVNCYVADGYYSEGVVADGPWEAIFRFCAKHKVNPKDVSVSTMIRMPSHEYWCSVGVLPRAVFPTKTAIDAAIAATMDGRK